jgi:hypothetical protein
MRHQPVGGALLPLSTSGCRKSTLVRRCDDDDDDIIMGVRREDVTMEDITEALMEDITEGANAGDFLFYVLFCFVDKTQHDQGW